MPDDEELLPHWRERCGVDPFNPPDGIKWAISPACDPAAGRPPYTFDDLPGEWLQIQAVRDIPEHDVRAGDLGGYLCVDTLLWVERPTYLLADSGAAWLGQRACVMTYEDSAGVGQAVEGDALVEGDPDGWVLLDVGAHVSGSARVTGNVRLRSAHVSDEAIVQGNAQLDGGDTGGAVAPETVTVSGQAMVGDNARLFRAAHVTGNSQVHGDAVVGGDATISGNAVVCTDNAEPPPPEPDDGADKQHSDEQQNQREHRYWGTHVGGSVLITGDVCVSGGNIGGNVVLDGDTFVFGNPKMTGRFHGAGGAVGGQVLCSGGRSFGTITGDNTVRFVSGTLEAGATHSQGMHAAPLVSEEEARTAWDRKVQELGLAPGDLMRSVPASQLNRPSTAPGRKCGQSGKNGKKCDHPVNDHTVVCAAGHPQRRAAA